MDTVVNDTMRVEPWVDPLVDQLGHDPRSPYCETFWLPVIGPSALWCGRRLVAWLDVDPDGTIVEVAALARQLGLGDGMGRHAPLPRTLNRLCDFGLARRNGDGSLQLRRRWPTLPAARVRRLPDVLQGAHEQWTARAELAAVAS